MSVLVYRENPVDRWALPFQVLSTNGKQVWLNTGNSVKLFFVEKIKEYRPEEADEGAAAVGAAGAPEAEAFNIREVVEVAEDESAAQPVTRPGFEPSPRELPPAN